MPPQAFYRLVTTFEKYGRDIQLPAYEDILVVKEIAEEQRREKQGWLFLKLLWKLDKELRYPFGVLGLFFYPSSLFAFSSHFSNRK